MNGDDFDILGEISDVEVIAVGSSIRELERLRRVHGHGRWRKMKGKALIRTFDGAVRQAETHWYGAHGIGKGDFKIKKP